MNFFVAIAGSYFVVAALGFALGRIVAELQTREGDSWPALADVDWPSAERCAYDWHREGVL